MFPLQRILSLVIPFFSTLSAVYALATPEEAEAGKVKGWVGSVGHVADGDLLSATFCYCEYPEDKMEDVMGPAHYYQFEYYNAHRDMSFILYSACPDGDIGFDRTCVPPHKDKVASMEILAGGTMGKICKLWSGYEELPNDHFQGSKSEMCYKADWDGNDAITFNGQKRKLGAKGHQRRIYEEEEVTEECRSMCDQYLEMPLLNVHHYPKSHRVTWILDDMCPGCK